MSQAGIINIIQNNPQIPTQFDADVGFAVPLGNVLEILGDVVVAGVNPVQTTASGNTLVVNVQVSQAIASTNINNIGLSAFNSTQFSVDPNGFVSLLGDGLAIDQINVDANTPPGTDPVVADMNGQITVTGAQAVASTVGANVIRTISLAANTYTIQIQQSGSASAENTALNGVAHFNSNHFTVSNGFVSLGGGGLAIDQINVDASTAPGTDPVLPDSNGQITVTGAQVAAGTVGANVLRTNSLVANTYAIEIQRSTAVSSSNSVNNGVSHYNSGQFTVDSNGFVSSKGGGLFWENIGASQTLVVNHGYFCSSGGALSLALPATSTVGDTIAVNLIGSTSWTITQAAGQQIQVGNVATTLGAGGSLASNAQGDAVWLVCRTANTLWIAVNNPVGVLTVT